jgi:hypothetical protein
MVRTRALVVSAETVTPVTTLCGRSHRLFAVFSMRRRVNPYSVCVDVRAVLNQLRLARRGRRRVRMDYQRCNQSHRKYDHRENFHADSPCLNQRLTHPNLLQCVVRGASNLCLYSPGAGPISLSFAILAILSIERLCRRDEVSGIRVLDPAGVARDSRFRWSRILGGNGVVGSGSRHYRS